MHPLISPAAPFVALAIAGVCLAAIGLLGVERERQLLAGFRARPSASGMRARYIAGQAAALPLAGLLLAVAAASGARGTAQSALLLGALGVYLAIGVVLPRRPVVARQRAAAELRCTLPAFLAYVQIAIEGYEAPGALLERYVARPNPRQREMQAAVTRALALHIERGERPFAALLTVARDAGCAELRDVAEQLAESERNGASPLSALAACAKTLEAILRDEFQRMLKRRMLYLMGTVAVSLVVGILGNLLFVMTRGGTLLIS